MDYNDILQKLKEKRDDTDADIRILEKWFTNRGKGDCPVDLSVYGIDLVELAHLERLHMGLRERRDIHQLGDAVYDADALEGEGKLPPKLRVLLKEAREFYDKTRRDMDNEIAAIRSRDVVALVEAVEMI